MALISERKKSQNISKFCVEIVRGYGLNHADIFEILLMMRDHKIITKTEFNLVHKKLSEEE